MRDDAPSRTAQWVAAARGLGRFLADDVRLADDPYGVAFSSATVARLLGRVRGDVAKVPGVATWVVYMQVRTRVIDDAVRAFVADGGRQVVVLGAGYDTRALRMAELADARVFEVDHPATQDHKLVVLARLRAESPARMIAWDFETRPMDELPEALAAAGHDAAAPTLTIWEGVTMYLSEGAIDASLDAIRAWSAPGSGLVMTYFVKTAQRPSLAARAFQAVVERVGEPFLWGWQPAELPGFLAERGFELARDVAMPEAARALLPAALAGLIAGRRDSRIAFATLA